MAKNAKTNASANEVVNTTTITKVSVNNKNGLLTIHTSGEFPHVSHDETENGNYILVTISSFIKALDIPELCDLSNCIEEIQWERNNLFLRKNKSFLTKKLQYLSEALQDVEIKVKQTEIAAFGTYEWEGKTIPNPYTTTNGEYSSPIILSFIEFTGEGIDECEVDEKKHIFNDWDTTVAIKHDYLKDILGCNNKPKTKAKPKSLADKVAEKAAEEDEQ